VRGPAAIGFCATSQDRTPRSAYSLRLRRRQPLDENPCPFDEAGRKETTEGADEDFLEKGGVHPCLPATIVPLHEGLYKIFDLARSRSQLTPRFSAVTRARRASQTV
jgi:hypothetical protein